MNLENPFGQISFDILHKFLFLKHFLDTSTLLRHFTNNDIRRLYTLDLGV